jgi:hypothetical protein
MWSTSSSSNFLNFNRNSIIEKGNDASEPPYHGVNSAFDDYYVLYEDRPVQKGGNFYFFPRFCSLHFSIAVVFKKSAKIMVSITHQSLLVVWSEFRYHWFFARYK